MTPGTIPPIQLWVNWHWSIELLASVAIRLFRFQKLHAEKLPSVLFSVSFHP